MQKTPKFREDIKMNQGINPLRIAVIGCGNRGRGHMRIVHSFEDVDLVAVCDPMESARSRVAHEFKVDRGYAKVEDLLKELAPDAVIVATPPHLNAEVAQVCLENGSDTLVEKPPGFTVKETEKLREAAARTGAKAMVGWNRRFHPLIVKARSLVLERGPITQLVGEFHKSITQLKQSGIFTEQVLDNMFLESPIHALDTLCALDGTDVAEVHSYVRRAISQYKDVHAALVVFESGCACSVIANYTTDARLERYEIHGHDISVYLEGVSRAVVFADGKSTELKGGGAESTVQQNRFFLDCVRDNRPIELPAANLDEAVKTMNLAERILGGLRE